ncbi:MAG: DUF1761 domain-containing protein [Candidatus Babeliales bacterium]
MISVSSWVGVAVAGVVYWLIGAIWYAPPVFGNLWMKLVKFKPDGSSMVGVMIKGLLVSWLAAAGLACFVTRLGITDLWQGALVGLTAWVGLVLPVALQAMFYEKYNLDHFLINAGYNLLGFMAMGAVLAYFG